MTDTIGLQELFFGTMAGAAIVMMGAFYALFFALARLHDSRGFMGLAAVSYLLLTLAVAVLVDALSLDGFWVVVAAVMLLGYLLAPQAIWKLCVGTHAGEPVDNPAGTTS